MTTDGQKDLVTAVKFLRAFRSGDIHRATDLTLKFTNPDGGMMAMGMLLVILTAKQPEIDNQLKDMLTSIGEDTD